MLLRSYFVFFDYEEPLAFFYLDYIAVMGLFIAAGYYVCIFAMTKYKNISEILLNTAKP